MFDQEKSTFLELPIIEQLIILTEEITEGFTDGFEVWIKLQEIENVFDTAKKTIKPTLLSELERNDGKLEQNGANFSVTISGRYDYSKDTVWSQISEQQKKREDLLKAAYKSAANGTQLITEDGETIPVPEYKPSEKSIKITFKKK